MSRLPPRLAPRTLASRALASPTIAFRAWAISPAWLLVAAILAYGGWWGWRIHVRAFANQPFTGLWLAGLAVALPAATLLARRLRPAVPRLAPVEALAVIAAVGMVLTDAWMAWSQPLRDLGIYLKAGQHYLAGGAVYMQSVATVKPQDPTDYPFLYPPLTLPFFGLLSMVPFPIAAALWVAGCAGLVCLALRCIGVPVRWTPFAVLFPPVFQVLFVGNVAAPGLALFAIAPFAGAALVLGPLFKAYTGITSLWLIRERRWLEIVAGGAVLAALVVGTLPLTGAGLWFDWLTGLRLYNESQSIVRGFYGFGLPRYLPFAVWAAVSGAAVLLALAARGREGLARLGTATVVASPSLFGHGLLLALPSLLALRSTWLWFTLGILAIPDGLQWWPAVAVLVVSWFVPAMRRVSLPAARLREPLHPLGLAREPWPAAGQAPRGAIERAPAGPAIAFETDGADHEAADEEDTAAARAL